MANFSGMVLTKRGRNLLAKALAGTNLTFTRVKLGSGQYNDNTDIENLNDLLQPKLALPIQSIEVAGDGTAKIRFVLRNDGLTEGFFLSEIGVFANDPDFGEILYSVAYASQPDFIPSSQTTRIEIVVDVYVVVSNAQSVTATISDTLVLATRQDIEKLKNSIISGQVIAGNALKLSGHEASIDPQPFRIPSANGDGKLGFEWLYDISEEVYYWSNYYVSTDFPQAEEGSLCYITNTNKLYRYTEGRWQEINWQKVIRRMPEFQSNRLRINNNALEISPNGTDWYPCYPLIGASVFNIRTLDNQNYSYKYYLPPGATVIIENANHVPIVYTPAVVPMFFFQGAWTHAFEYWVGLRPSNIAISNGDGQHVGAGNSNVGANRVTGLSIVPFYEQSNINENWNHATLTIRENQRWLVLGQCQGHGGFDVINTCCSGTAPSTSYWLGTWYRQDGVQFTANYVTITRRR
ncbi:MAG: phage tail protein [Desulfurococcaceae archaeon]